MISSKLVPVLAVIDAILLGVILFAGGTACCPDGFAWAGRPAKSMTPSSIASITANTGTSFELIMTNASLLS